MPKAISSPAGASLRLAALLLAFPAVAELTLHPCELTGSQGANRVGAHCGSLEVPEDPAKPQGPRIQLFVARISALNSKPAADAVTIINGGPGASSVNLYVDLQQAFSGLRRNRDIVLVDQRGTGRSGALPCPALETAMDAYAAKRVRAATRQCLTDLTPDPRHYTTSIAVQDLERVRLTLGYDQWNIYGVSYGTRVAQHYARRYPNAVRTLTLDGVVPPQASLGPDIALDAQATLDALLSRCGQNRACSQAFPALESKLASLSTRLRDAPVALQPAHPVTGQRQAFTLTYPHLASTLRLLSYAPETASLIPLIINEASEKQNYLPLATQAMRIETEVIGAISLGMHNSVICTEDVPFYGNRQIPWDKLDATYLGGDQVRALKTICEVWPAGSIDADFKQPLETNVPTLLLSGEFDPVTPPSAAALAQTGLPHSLHVVAPGQGHGVVGRGCIPALLSDFVERGRLETLRPSCVDRLKPAPFFVDLMGPAP